MVLFTFFRPAEVSWGLSHLKDSPLNGRARIKTGLVNGVRSMAGYVNARNGRHYSVVMMIDTRQVNYWNGNAVQDVLLEWVYYLGTG